MTLKVKTYSGYKADQYPISFAIDDKEYIIDKILDSGVGEYFDYWKVDVGGKKYLLKLNKNGDEWSLEARYGVFIV